MRAVVDANRPSFVRLMTVKVVPKLMRDAEPLSRLSVGAIYTYRF